MSYLLDADVFIRAKNLHYGMDFCPAFWDWLVDRSEGGVVWSVERAGDEVQAGGDELADWARAPGPSFRLGFPHYGSSSPEGRSCRTRTTGACSALRESRRCASSGGWQKKASCDSKVAVAGLATEAARSWERTARNGPGNEPP